MATDNQGDSTQSVPVHIGVLAPPVMSIRYSQGMAIIDWTPADAILQTAPTINGPWQERPNVRPPVSQPPTGQAMFFRARLP